MHCKPLRWIGLVVLMALITSCVSERTSWNKRIGVYTYDQALLELGPPDKQARLSDGRRIAEWVSHYSTGNTLFIGSGIWGYPGGMGFMEGVGPDYYESKLRLTFGTNDVLAAWSRD